MQVYGIGEEEYRAYVKSLKDLGYEDRLDVGSWSFHGENRDGVTVEAAYEGFETMYLRVYVPTKTEE